MNNEDTWLLVGGSGYFGSYLARNLLRSTSDSVISTFFNSRPHTTSRRLTWLPLELSPTADMRAALRKVEVRGHLRVVILSSVHHPDRVEADFGAAAAVNFAGLTCLLGALPSDAQVMYVSSDVVYGESLEKYFFHEIDRPNPINAYGRQKSVAEQIALAHGHDVVRCSFLIGPSLIDRPHFHDQILASLKNGTSLPMLVDQYRTAIDYDQAASLIVRLMQAYTGSRIGIVNVGSDSPMSKYQVAMQIAHAFELSTDSLVPVKFEKSSLYSNKRAKDILMDNSKLKKLLGLQQVICRFGPQSPILGKD